MGATLGDGLEWGDPPRLRHLIANAALPGHDLVPDTVGNITLMAHQREAVGLVRGALQRFGGALLADPVGTGKTYVALATTTAYAQATIVCPATLRPMWTRALASAGLRCPLHSFESLGRGGNPAPCGADELLIVDEAHHARNPATQRYDALARLAWGRHVLLLTATPVHNTERDLHALCRLFLGEAASRLSAATLARLVCRRVDVAPAALPSVRPPVWLSTPDPERLHKVISQLPPPVPPSDGGSANALGTLALLRQWCSSESALLAALNRRVETGVAMETQLAQGRQITRADLRRWMVGPGVLQLELSLTPDEGVTPPGTHEHLQYHLAGIRALRQRLRSRPLDAERLGHLRTIISRHLPQRCVLFTHAADTARAVYRALAPAYRCALLTGAGAHIAHGRTRRDDIVQSFSPHASTPDAMRVDVLIATDVLSEGVDLHAAQVIVHLDLPWTVARLEQRVGRLRRLGALHSDVVQYAFSPPGDGDKVLRLMRRLTRKSGVSQGLIGNDAAPFLAMEPSGRRSRARGVTSDLQALHQLRRELSTWTTAAEQEGPAEHLAVSAIASRRGSPAFVALIASDTVSTVVAGTPLGISAAPRDVLEACQAVSPMAAGIPIANPGDPAVLRHLRRTQQRLAEWCAAEDTRLAMVSEGSGAIHRKVIRRVGGLRALAGRRARREAACELGELREVVLRSVGAGAERFLSQWLLDHPPKLVSREDLARLRAALAPRARRVTAAGGEHRVVALLLIVPER